MIQSLRRRSAETIALFVLDRSPHGCHQLRRRLQTVLLGVYCRLAQDFFLTVPSDHVLTIRIRVNLAAVNDFGHSGPLFSGSVIGSPQLSALSRSRQLSAVSF